MCFTVTILLCHVNFPKRKNCDIPVTDYLTNNFSTFIDEYNKYNKDKVVATKVIRHRTLLLNNNQFFIVVESAI